MNNATISRYCPQTEPGENLREVSGRDLAFLGPAVLPMMSFLSPCVEVTRSGCCPTNPCGLHAKHSQLMENHRHRRTVLTFSRTRIYHSLFSPFQVFTTIHDDPCSLMMYTIVRNCTHGARQKITCPCLSITRKLLLRCASVYRLTLMSQIW